MGTAQSTLKSHWGAYLRALATSPLRTKMYTAMVLSGVQEYVSQRILRLPKVEYKSVLQVMVYAAAISTPMAHFLQLFYSSFITRPLLRVLFVLLVNVPLLTAAYLITFNLLRGTPVSSIPKVLRVALPPILVRIWKVYPPLIIIVQKLLPPVLWVPAFQVVGFVVGVITKVSSRRAQMALAQKGQKGQDKES